MFLSPKIDWTLMLACLSKLNYYDAALIRIFVSFGCHTGEQTHHWSADHLCPACKQEGVVDSLDHRFCCPALADFKASYHDITQWAQTQSLLVRRTGIFPQRSFIGVLHDYIARNDPDFVRILPEHSIRRAYWIVAHNDVRDLARVRLVYDYIVDLTSRLRSNFA
jgi:hypothetical protein